jgi:CTP:molybdopterin cytidylyltransferase MocA
MSPKVKALIQRALEAPKTHAVVVTFSDGHVHRHETRSRASAQTHVDFVWAPRLNQPLIDRKTGRLSHVNSVEIVALAA